MSKKFHGLDGATIAPGSVLMPTRAISLREVIQQIEALRERHGDAVLDAPCTTEGCDCTGACSGIEGDPDGVLFKRVFYG